MAAGMDVRAVITNKAIVRPAQSASANGAMAVIEPIVFMGNE